MESQSAFIFAQCSALALVALLPPLGFSTFTSMVSKVERVYLEKRARATVVLVSFLHAYGHVIAIHRTPEWYTTYSFSYCWME